MPKEKKIDPVRSLYSSLSGWGGLIATGLGLGLCFVPMAALVQLAVVAALLGVGVMASGVSYFFNRNKEAKSTDDPLIPVIAIGINALAVIALVAMALTLSLPGLVGPVAVGVAAMSLLGFAAQNGFWAGKETQNLLMGRFGSLSRTATVSGCSVPAPAPAPALTPAPARPGVDEKSGVISPPHTPKL